MEWTMLHNLLKLGEAYSLPLSKIIEQEKNALLVEHLKRIADEGDFVELLPDPPGYDRQEDLETAIIASREERQLKEIN